LRIRVIEIRLARFHSRLSPMNALKPRSLVLLLACCMVPGCIAQEQIGSPFSPLLTPREKACYSTETEPLKPLATKLFKNVLLDQKEIWTSPFHMKRSDAQWWILFGAATGALFATDHWTSQQLPNTKDQIRFSGHVSDVGIYALAPLTGGFYLVGVFSDNAKARQTGLLGAEALIDGVVLFEALKLATGRERPSAGDGHGHFFRGGDSFPSGHAMESFALASVIAHTYRNKKMVPVLAYGLAALVSASRLSDRQHFASDVVVGGAMGWFIGTYVFRTHQNASSSPRSAIKAILSPQVSPEFQPGVGSYGISLSWHPGR
jgi:membrane-associated phospholipid phosphatase